MKKILNCFVLIVLFFSFNVQAQDINHFNTTFDDSLSNNVNGSSFVAGDSVDVSNYVRGVNFICGNRIKYDGQSDYLAIAGNSIDINGKVNNDTIIFGNIVNINSKAELQRDAIIFASDIEIGGFINRDITLYGGKVSLKGANIYGNITIYAEEITINKDSIINGKLSYPEDAKVSIEANVNNVGKISSTQSRNDNILDFVVNKVWSIMSIVLIFALLTLIMPKLFEKIQEKYEVVTFNKGVETFTKGLVFMIIVPVISVMLLMFPFGIPLSLIMIALYIIIIYLSKLFTGYFIGYKFWQKFINSDVNVLLVGLFGFLIIFIISLVPLISSLFAMFTIFYGIGIVLELLLDKKSN